MNFSKTVPFGVSGFGTKILEDNPRDYKNEQFLLSVQDRHTYFQKLPKPKPKVRLRPRQVRCLNCKSICSETGENVQRPLHSYLSRNQSSQSRNHNDSRSFQELYQLCVKTKTSRLIPRIKRLSQNDLRQHQNQTCSDSKKPVKIRLRNVNQGKENLKQLLNSNTAKAKAKATAKVDKKDSSDNQSNFDKSGARSLRTKRCAVGSMEDLWDESILSEPSEKKIKSTAIKYVEKGLDQIKDSSSCKPKSLEPEMMTKGDVVWAKYNESDYWPAKVDT